jgi:hypothetical protein
MTSWCRNRRIFAECAQRGIYLPDAPLDWSDDDRADVVQDTVHNGVRRFRRRALVERGWLVNGGSTLSSYFIGTCVYCFADVNRTWHDHETLLRLTRYELTPQLGDAPPLVYRNSFEHDLVSSHATVQILNALREGGKELTAQILALLADGSTFQEVAEALPEAGTIRAIEGRLYRLRQSHDIQQLKAQRRR